MQVLAHQISTFYQRAGTNQPVVVLLHGWGHTHTTFAQLTPGLADRFTVVIPDLPAFGQSAHPQPQQGKAWNTANYTHWLHDFLLQVVGDQPYILVGHSFGGKVAAWYAATFPHPNLQKLILMDAAGLPTPLTFKEQLVQALAKTIPPKLKTPQWHHQVSQILKKVGVAADYQQANPHQQAILRQIVREDLTEIFPNIAVSTLIIWGEHDSTTPLTAGQQMATLIPHATLQVIPESGHCPFHDQPRLTLQAIYSYIP